MVYCWPRVWDKLLVWFGSTALSCVFRMFMERLQIWRIIELWIQCRMILHIWSLLILLHWQTFPLTILMYPHPTTVLNSVSYTVRLYTEVCLRFLHFTSFHFVAKNKHWNKNFSDRGPSSEQHPSAFYRLTRHISFCNWDRSKPMHFSAWGASQSTSVQVTTSPPSQLQCTLCR